MGEVIVVTSGKGGVGKTTTTGNIGIGLTLQGKKVALIDGDIGLRNLDIILGLENRIVYDLVDVVEKKCKLQQALIRDKRFEGLYLLPAAQTRDKNAVSPENMKEVCEELKKDFDFVIIDCPAGIEQGFKNAIVAIDRAIIVTNPEVSAVRDADRVVALLESELVKDIKLVINRIKPEMVEKGDMMSVEDVKEILAIDIIGIVPEDQQIIVASNKGEPSALEGISAAGKAYRNIAKRILGEEVAFDEIEKPKTMWQKIMGLFKKKKTSEDAKAC